MTENKFKQRFNHKFEFATPGFVVVVSYSVFNSYMLRIYECAFCFLACFVFLSVYTSGENNRTIGRPKIH